MMKYSHLGIALLAVASLCLPAWSQITAPPNPAIAAASNYASAVAMTDAVIAADEPILTIKRRGDEVYVLFIPPDRPGKFFRDSNQEGFVVLADHKRLH